VRSWVIKGGADYVRTKRREEAGIYGGPRGRPQMPRGRSRLARTSRKQREKASLPAQRGLNGHETDRELMVISKGVNQAKIGIESVEKRGKEERSPQGRRRKVNLRTLF